MQILIFFRPAEIINCFKNAMSFFIQAVNLFPPGGNFACTQLIHKFVYFPPGGKTYLHALHFYKHESLVVGLKQRRLPHGCMENI